MEEKLTKLNVRNFNTDGMEKTQNENFKNESDRVLERYVYQT